MRWEMQENQTEWESNENKPTLTLFTEAQSIFLTFAAVAQPSTTIPSQPNAIWREWTQRHLESVVITTNIANQNARKLILFVVIAFCFQFPKELCWLLVGL